VDAVIRSGDSSLPEAKTKDGKNTALHLAASNEKAVFPTRCGIREIKLLIVKGKGQVLDIALLHDEHMLRSALQSRKWQLIGMS